MSDLLPILAELGLKPTELLILFMLWQNIKNSKLLLDRLVEKMSQLEIKL